MTRQAVPTKSSPDPGAQERCPHQWQLHNCRSYFGGNRCLLLAARRLYLKMVQWTGSKVAHKEFAGRKHRIVNSLRCNIASKARGRHYTTSRGSRCVSQQGWAHDVRSGSFSPLGHRSTSLPWSAAHSIAVVIGAHRHSHLVPKGDQVRRSRTTSLFATEGRYIGPACLGDGDFSKQFLRLTPFFLS
jgi:hypothetical protein